MVLAVQLFNNTKRKKTKNLKNYVSLTVNVEIFDARKFRALWTGPIIFNFRAH